MVLYTNLCIVTPLLSILLYKIQCTTRQKLLTLTVRDLQQCCDLTAVKKIAEKGGQYYDGMLPVLTC